MRICFFCLRVLRMNPKLLFHPQVSYNTHTTKHTLTVILSLADAKLQIILFCLQLSDKLFSSYTANWSAKYCITNTAMRVERKYMSGKIVKLLYRTLKKKIACLLSEMNDFYLWAIADKMWIIKNICACWWSTKKMYS